MSSTIEVMKAIAVLFEDDDMTIVEAEDTECRGLVLLTFETLEHHKDRINAVVSMVKATGMFADWPIHIFHPDGMAVFAANGDEWPSRAIATP
jgi:hypothetical protein